MHTLGRHLEGNSISGELYKTPNKYPDYAKIVNYCMEKVLLELDFDCKKYQVNTDYEYFIPFENYLKDIIVKHLSGPPDSFIIGSCLAYALIDSKRISLKNTQKATQTLLMLNYKIAIEVALNLASEPLIYIKDMKGKFTPNKLKKVNLDCIKLKKHDTIFNANCSIEDILLNTLSSEYTYFANKNPLVFSVILEKIYNDFQDAI